MGRRKKTIILHNVKLTGIADKGLCVGREETGKVVFVEDAVPGDVVDVLVTKKKNDYILGKPVLYHEYSSDRIPHFCQHFGYCGGCKWQHLSYEAQLRYKHEVVVNALQRIAKIPVGELRPIMGADPTVYYRNKMEFAFSNRRWLTEEEMAQGLDKEVNALGFHRPGAFDKVLDINKCWLQPDPSNAIRNEIRVIAQEQNLSCYDLKKGGGFLRNLLVRVTTLSEVMVLISFGNESPELIKPFLTEVSRRLPQITTLMYCVNPKLNDTLYDLDMQVFTGKGYIEEVLGKVRFRIGPKSFFQTNSRQAERLYNVVADFAALGGNENVYDLYTGLGSIALYVAHRARQVVGIEEVSAAIEDARENAQLNNIDNAIFYAGDVKDILTTDFAARHGAPDVLITDPPRAGMHPQVVEMLLQLACPRIVYVSCNPATQARDLQKLSEKYDVLKVQPVDMFPHTHHIESVALLELKKGSV